MASSDEEGEFFPDSVNEYEFVNQANEHVSVACLPLQWRKDEVAAGDANMRIFLSGECDDGLQKIYKHAVAWMFELSFVQPEISVLCKGNHWVKLLKPKKVFEGALRSILVSIHCLHFIKHNLEATEESIWQHLSRVFSTFEVGPSEVDCRNHISLIRDVVERDKDLASSEYLLRVFLEQPIQGTVRQVEALPVKKPEFIVDEVTDDPCEADEICNGQEELFDTCCSLCDNGGNILCCEGRCMRSFHATDHDDDDCDGIGLSDAQVKAMPIFICENCQYQQHQCFICGRLGSSDISANAEVFPCIAANCGRFYHPKCVSKELRQRNFIETENLEEKIAVGESFVCPAHRCFDCKQVEDRTVDDMQFAVCRRCPKSYHSKCLPSEITFDGDEEKGILQRAWKGLLPKRILIYCMDHEIDPEYGTPERDHICFPHTKIMKRLSSKQQVSEVNVEEKKRKLIRPHSPSRTSVQMTGTSAKKVHLTTKGSESSRLVEGGLRRPNFDGPKNTYSSNVKSSSAGSVKLLPKPPSSSSSFGVNSLIGNNRFNFDKKMSAMKPSNANIPDKKLSTLHSAKPQLKKQGCSNPVVDSEMERRITAMMVDVNTSFDVDEFMKQQSFSLDFKKNTQDLFDKNLTKGKVEVACKAVREALQKLERGGSLDDAKTVCSPEMLRQVPLWKNKLALYLAPFLHGTCYSSYGRHFTKLEKLQEIVDRLHWYVQDGDMIVDFCCGSNDFSILMKQKLDSVGKKNCSFRNYDLFPPKNDFNFEQKDWFTVAPEELPPGSRVIMGLNPPFGFKACLANKFIRKALQFKPKLLILIVPPETHRLDSRFKKTKYDLIWEDMHLLSGQSFYIPGAFDANDNQLSQWNHTTPPLYLWSHPNCTKRHKEIANRHNHFWGRGPGKPPCGEPATWNYLPPEQHDGHSEFSSLMTAYGNFSSMQEDVLHIDERDLYKYNRNLVRSHTYGHNGPMRDDFSNLENPRRMSLSSVPNHDFNNLENARRMSSSSVANHEFNNLENARRMSLSSIGNHNNVPRYENPGRTSMGGWLDEMEDIGHFPNVDYHSNVPSNRDSWRTSVTGGTGGVEYTARHPSADDICHLPRYQSPPRTSMAGRLGGMQNVAPFSAVDDLDDMDISPINSPRFNIS